MHSLYIGIEIYHIILFRVSFFPFTPNVLQERVGDNKNLIGYEISILKVRI